MRITLPEASNALGATGGVSLLKLGHIQNQGGVLGNKRVWYSPGGKWSGSVNQNGAKQLC